MIFLTFIIPGSDRDEPEYFSPVTETDSAFWAWMGLNWWWVLMAVMALWFAMWPVRRYFRQLRRREPWSLERATWSISGFHPTGRIFKKWGRYNRDGQGVR